jgi:hypothetical protein
MSSSSYKLPDVAAFARCSQWGSAQTDAGNSSIGSSRRRVDVPLSYCPSGGAITTSGLANVDKNTSDVGGGGGGKMTSVSESFPV